MKNWMIRFVLVAAMGLFSTTGLSATDGHFLHGVGAINSAMGGVGVAAPQDVLGALYNNPAGLMSFKGTRADMSMELFKAQLNLTATAPTAQGPFTGSQDGKSGWMPIPAFGWSTELVEDKVVIGLGGLGIGGFGVDYRQNNQHPLLAPKSMGGFGQVYSNFSLLKITSAVAFQASEKLSIGIAANVDWASLAVDPFPAAAPNGSAYPGATSADGVFGLGFQLGLIYEMTEAMNLGLSYTSKQVFDDFEWNSVNDDASDPAFGTYRTFSFAMDAPAIIAGGISYQASDALFVEVDGKYLMYSSTAGFDETGFDATGAVKGFGWDDIFVVAAGASFVATDKIVLRGGYNFSQNPIPDENAFFNVAAPAIVQHHITVGAGFELVEGLEVSAAYYMALENEVSGPMWHPMMGQVPGSNVTSSMSENSLMIQFSFTGK